ncbi:hypothetical protein [Streptomyces sp. MS1.AVA.4]|uniref:Uncharacterized protein n=1 Tax=Streptomyces pratisoli TaxID=3139917 RepID=A0ACC6QAK1_9ACTN
MTRHRHSTRGPAILTALAMAALAAGGGTAYADDDIETLTARQISAKAREALLGATSVHITSKGDLGRPGAPDELDLTLDRAGNCAGSVSMGESGSVEVIKRGTTVWLKPDAAFWKNHVPGAGEAAEAIVGDRYVRGSTEDSMLKGMAEVCDLDTFVNRLTGAPESDVVLTKGKKAEINDVDAIPLTGERSGRTITLYVATEGKPYPVRLVVKGAGAAEATVDFSAYDTPVPAGTPPADESIDLSTLMG